MVASPTVVIPCDAGGGPISAVPPSIPQFHDGVLEKHRGQAMQYKTTAVRPWMAAPRVQVLPPS